MGDLTDDLATGLRDGEASAEVQTESESESVAGDDAEVVEVWVHPSVTYAGGRYEEDVGEAFPEDSVYNDPDPFPEESSFEGTVGRAVREGSVWQEKVRNRGTEAFDRSVCVNNAEHGDEHYAARSDVPFGDDWDVVIDDPDDGNVPAERIAEEIEDADAVVLRGGQFLDCERRFAGNLGEALDEDQHVVVDMENSYAGKGSWITADMEPEEDRELRAQAYGRPAPTAAEADVTREEFLAGIETNAERFEFAAGLSEMVDRLPGGQHEVGDEARAPGGEGTGGVGH